MPPSLDSLVPPRGTAFGRAPAAAGQRGTAWVSVLLFLGLAAAGYLGWVWVPIYVDHYTVKQTTRDYMNRAVKDRDDAALLAGLSSALSRIAKTKVRYEDGTLWEVPAVDVPVEAISWDRDVQSTPPTLRVSFEYERTVYYPLLERTSVKRFVVSFESDITVPQWD